MTSADGPPEDVEDDGGVGYRQPPRASRFAKGQNGNPAGRPRGRHRDAPYEAVLGKMVTVREGGRSRQVTAAEAFLLQLTKRGLEGDDAAARASLAVIEEARGSQGGDQPRLGVIVVELVAPGSVTSALEPLRMARKLDPYRETARIALEPWLVEAALARLRPTLSPADQRTIVKATRTPPQGGPTGGANVRNPPCRGEGSGPEAQAKEAPAIERQAAGRGAHATSHFRLPPIPVATDTPRAGA